MSIAELKLHLSNSKGLLQASGFSYDMQRAQKSSLLSLKQEKHGQTKTSEFFFFRSIRDEVTGRITTPNCRETDTFREKHPQSAYPEPNRMKPYTGRSSLVMILTNCWTMSIGWHECEKFWGTLASEAFHTITGSISRNLIILSW